MMCFLDAKAMGALHLVCTSRLLKMVDAQGCGRGGGVYSVMCMAVVA